MSWTPDPTKTAEERQMSHPSNARYQPGELVMFLRMKARILEIHWDDLFAEWRYHYKITGKGNYYYPKGWSDWTGQSCLSKRS